MGVGYLYGNGGGGTGATLTVTAPDGVIVSVSKDGKTKRTTTNTQGLAVFKGLETGTWTLSITDGVQTTSKDVNIRADFSDSIAFFSATINITYPAGSICTCTNGSTTLTAPDTTGTWVCVVPSKGDWTVSCTDGIDSNSEVVSITEENQIESISVLYWNGELYEVGNQYENITGGWGSTGWTSGVASYGVHGATIDNTGMTFGYVQNQFAVAGTANKIDLSKYTTLHVTVSECYQTMGGYLAVHSEKKVGYSPLYNMTAIVQTTGTGTFTLSLNGIKEGYVVYFTTSGTPIKVSDIHLT